MRAEASFRAALAAWPRSYTALAGLARTRAARGDTAEAISLYQQAAAIVPQPRRLAALGDLYALAGRTAEAQQQYDTVRAIATLAAVNRQVYNRELALFDANHGVEPAEALRLADRRADDPQGRLRLGRLRVGAPCQRARPRGRRRDDPRPHARHARRALQLPRRHDRGRPGRHGPRPRRCSPRRSPSTRASTRSRPSRAARRPGGAAMRPAPAAPGATLAGAALAAPRAGGRARPSARQLHDQPLCRAAHRDDGGRPRRRHRPGRDPDLPGAAADRYEPRRHGRCGRDRGRAPDGLRRAGTPADADRGRWRDHCHSSSPMRASPSRPAPAA